MNVREELGTMSNAGVKVLSMPAGVVDDAGRKNIGEYINGSVSFPEKPIDDNRRLPCCALHSIIWEDVGCEWVVVKGKYSGTLPKRVSSCLFREYGVRLTKKQLSEIGNICKRHTVKEQRYVYDITDTFDWEAGDFGDSGSCYWGSNQSNRYALQDSGECYAVRLYRDDDGAEGYARAWIRTWTDKAVLFNVYGLDPGIQMARILSTVMGLSYKKVVLRSDLYINDSAGYLIGTSDIIDGVESVYLDIDLAQEFTCEFCDEGLAESETWTFDDTTMCHSCYEERASCCSHCGREMWNRDSMGFGDHDPLCQGCFDNHAWECDICCGTFWDDDDASFILDDDTLCEDCYTARKERAEVEAEVGNELAGVMA